MKDNKQNSDKIRTDLTLSSPLQQALDKYHRQVLKLNKPEVSAVPRLELPKGTQDKVQTIAATMKYDLIEWHESVKEYKKMYNSREFLLLSPSQQKEIRKEYKEINKEFFGKNLPTHYSDLVKPNQQAISDSSEVDIVVVAKKANEGLASTRQLLRKLTDKAKQMASEASEDVKGMKLEDLIGKATFEA